MFASCRAQTRRSEGARQRSRQSGPLRAWPIAALLACFLPLLGCSQYELNERGLDFNAALANNDNRQVLLNAARASKHYPLYFTAVSKVSTNGLLSQGTLSFTIPFGHHLGANSVAPGITLQEGIAADISPLDTQEFFEGFLSPISFDQYVYYQQYDWDRELLYYGLIRRVTIGGMRAAQIEAQAMAMATRSGNAACAAPATPLNAFNCFAPKIPNRDSVSDPAICFAGTPVSALTYSADRDAVVTFTNSPINRCEFLRFQLLVAEFRALGFQIVSTQPGKPDGPKSDDKKSGPKAGGAAAKDADKPAAPENNFYVLLDFDPTGCAGCPPARTLFPLSYKAYEALFAESPAARAPARPAPGRPGTAPPPRPTTRPPGGDCDPVGPANATPALFSLRHVVRGATPRLFVCLTAEVPPIVLRSPEGIVFFMGELIQAQNRDANPEAPNYGPFLPKINIYWNGADRPAPLLVVCRSGKTNQECAKPGRKEAAVSVDFDGDTYVIPKPPEAQPEQSMHLLTLAEQLLALQKIGSKLPTTPSVRVIQ